MPRGSREGMRGALIALGFLASSCSPEASGLDGGADVEDARATPDVLLAEDTGWPEGILVVAATEPPGLMDHGVIFNPDRLGSTVPIAGHANLEAFLWSRDEPCDDLLDPADDTPFLFVEMDVTVRGTRIDETTELPPTAGTYPVVRGVDPSHQPSAPATATVSVVRESIIPAESGTVVIESIDTDEMTILVDAVLEDGSAVRGRMTIGRECR